MKYAPLFDIINKAQVVLIRPSVFVTLSITPSLAVTVKVSGIYCWIFIHSEHSTQPALIWWYVDIYESYIVYFLIHNMNAVLYTEIHKNGIRLHIYVENLGFVLFFLSLPLSRHVFPEEAPTTLLSRSNFKRYSDLDRLIPSTFDRQIQTPVPVFWSIDSSR